MVQDNNLAQQIMKLGQLSEYTLVKHYDGPLGAVYFPEYTEFRLWSPSASQVELLIYDGYYGKLKRSHPMLYDEIESVFKYKIEGDCHGLTYNYRLTYLDGRQVVTVDPYAKAATVNGYRSVVVDLIQTNPDGWDKRMPEWETPEKTIIYEGHVRDLTIQAETNIRHKGKFLGLIEPDRVNTDGLAVGLDYLKELGITHLELLPIFDYATVDETHYHPNDYNWGYDPQNYNVPEGSYSTNPFDPMACIRELKMMILGLHQAGIRVIMDVVYNHVYAAENHPFHYTAPGYYFRYIQGNYTNGTGVGNDTASERTMMRKYIVDSVVYWAKEYHIDGFRFDLMGIHDVDTMNAVRQALDEVDPSIIILGEGWDLYTPEGVRGASQKYAPMMARIGQFNDGMREAIKGDDFNAESRGYINGAWYKEPLLASHIKGGVDFDHYLSPLQLIQYAEAHDNFTLYDKLKASNPHDSEEIREKRHMMASTIILISQGIPFIHAGQEFMRSKNGIRDSYNQPDEINQMDWKALSYRLKSIHLVRDLIALRKQEPLFTMKEYSDIAQKIRVVRKDYMIVHLEYTGTDYDLIVIINGQSNTLNVDIEPGDYTVKLYDNQVYLQDDGKVINVKKSVSIPMLTTLILKKFK